MLTFVAIVTLIVRIVKDQLPAIVYTVLLTISWTESVAWTNVRPQNLAIQLVKHAWLLAQPTQTKIIWFVMNSVRQLWLI